MVESVKWVFSIALNVIMICARFAFSMKLDLKSTKNLKIQSKKKKKKLQISKITDILKLNLYQEIQMRVLIMNILEPCHGVQQVLIKIDTKC